MLLYYGILYRIVINYFYHSTLQTPVKSEKKKKKKKAKQESE